MEKILAILICCCLNCTYGYIYECEYELYQGGKPIGREYYRSGHLGSCSSSNSYSYGGTYYKLLYRNKIPNSEGWHSSQEIRKETWRPMRHLDYDEE